MTTGDLPPLAGLLLLTALAALPIAEARLLGPNDEELPRARSLLDTPKGISHFQLRYRVHDTHETIWATAIAFSTRRRDDHLMIDHETDTGDLRSFNSQHTIIDPTVMSLRRSSTALFRRASALLDSQASLTQGFAPILGNSIARSFASDADLARTALYDFHVQNGGT